MPNKRGRNEELHARRVLLRGDAALALMDRGVSHDLSMTVIQRVPLKIARALHDELVKHPLLSQPRELEAAK